MKKLRNQTGNETIYRLVPAGGSSSLGQGHNRKGNSIRASSPWSRRWEEDHGGGCPARAGIMEGRAYTVEASTVEEKQPWPEKCPCNLKRKEKDRLLRNTLASSLCPLVVSFRWTLSELLGSLGNVVCRNEAWSKAESKQAWNGATAALRYRRSWETS